MASGAPTSRGPRVLILVTHFPPAFKAGGPTRSLPSIIKCLSPSIRFHVITSDRDEGENHPLDGVRSDSWSSRDGASCLYLSPGVSFLARLRRGINRADHDVLYANSIFSIPYTLAPLVMRRLSLIPRKRMVIAPRGELAPGALGLKKMSKMVYMWLIQQLRLTTDVTWHATSDAEVGQIRKAFGEEASVVLASNISTASSSGAVSRTPKIQGELHAVFISRISRKKNLHFAFSVLSGVEARVVLHVYGPTEDQRYWRECQRQAKSLPPNIEVQYLGPLQPDEVSTVLLRYDLFFLPTLGENFGYAIAEALVAGCPVLISDQTPWRGLTRRFAGWDLPLTSIEQFRRAIDYCAEMSADEHARWVDGARSVGLEAVARAGVGPTYLRLFGLGGDELPGSAIRS